jgi:two-component system CheB/CheR fusion protein
VIGAATPIGVGIGASAVGLDEVLALLRGQTGHDFSGYGRSTLRRRLERRMGLHQIDRLQRYVRILRDDPRELELLFKDLLIGVTRFFRDPRAWERLERHVLPALVEARASSRALRAWVPGCSTGEEAYSLAIVLHEALERRGQATPLSVQLFATDLDVEALERARQGIYPASIQAHVSPERLGRFFVQDEHGYRVSRDIRESVVFAPQDVAKDPPFTRLDLLSCRNLLIYLSPELQRKLIALFHDCLNPGGVLFLGGSETVGISGGHLFVPADGRTRVFRRVDSSSPRPVVLPSSSSPPAQHTGGAIAEAGAVTREPHVPALHGERPRRPAPGARVARLERELAQARDELQAAREEMQTAQEGLESTNEALQSANEALQTVNHALQARVEELSRSSDDMRNLLDATDAAALFLDGEMRVRWFTSRTAKLIQLAPGDAGRPLADITTELDYPDLPEEAREVLRTLVTRERQVSIRDGRRFAVRLLPCHTLENGIDGVLVTFTEMPATR